MTDTTVLNPNLTVEQEESEESMATLRHGAIIVTLGVQLAQYAGLHDLGRVFGPQTTYHLPVAGVPKPKEREPDLSFVARARLPQDLDIEPEFAPDLVVEVVSRTDTYGEVEARVRQYLATGTRLIWIVRPGTRAVEVYRPGEMVEVRTERDDLDGAPVLPGLRLRVADIFV